MLASFALFFSVLTAQEQVPPITAEAEAYIDRALDILEENGLNSDAVDWVAIRSEALELAAHAQVPADTYPAVRFALNRLNPHSLLYLREELLEIEADRRDNFPQYYSEGFERIALEGPERPESEEEWLLLRRHPSLTLMPGETSVHAMISVPGASRDMPGTATLAERIRTLIASGAGHACGYILDLRGNGGGTMWPMLLGVEPFLRGQVTGSIHSPNAGTSDYIVEPGRSGLLRPDGRETIIARTEADPGPDLSAAPVAVLLNRFVGSSGEAVAMAFRGRPNTRFFGEMTAGYTTSNQGYPMPDGAVLIVTTGIFQDRTGASVDFGIPVDVETLPGATTDTAPAITEALTWLDGQSCHTMG